MNRWRQAAQHGNTQPLLTMVEQKDLEVLTSLYPAPELIRSDHNPDSLPTPCGVGVGATARKGNHQTGISVAELIHRIVQRPVQR